MPSRGLNPGWDDRPSTQVNHSSFGHNRAFLTTAIACSMTSIILFVVYDLPPELGYQSTHDVAALYEKVGWRHFFRFHSSS